MFRPGVCSGPTLYSDLDNVIAAPLDCLLSIPRHPIVMLDDRREEGMPNGGFMLFEPSLMPDLWSEYADNPLAVESEFSVWPHAADQAFIADRVRKAGGTVRLAQRFLGPGRILNARSELHAGVDWSNAMLVYGSWHPKPHESTHPFYAEHWR